MIFSESPRFPSYGVMHAKVMLLLSHDWCRVVVSSANLVPYDYDQVQNVLCTADPRADGLDYVCSGRAEGCIGHL